MPKYLYQWLVLMFIDTLGNTMENKTGRKFNKTSNYVTQANLFWEAGEISVSMGHLNEIKSRLDNLRSYKYSCIFYLYYYMFPNASLQNILHHLAKTKFLKSYI